MTWLAVAAAVFLALHLGAWIMNVTPEHKSFLERIKAFFNASEAPAEGKPGKA